MVRNVVSSPVVVFQISKEEYIVMRKKFLVCLMLIACVLMQAMPVMAAGELTVAQLEALPGPGSDADLIDSGDYKQFGSSVEFANVINGVATCTYMYDSPGHVLSYSPTSGMFLYCVEESKTLMNEAGEVDSEYTVLAQRTSSSLATAISESVVLKKGDNLEIFSDVNAWFLFVQSGSSSIGFACKVSELSDYAYNRFSGMEKADGESGNITIRLLEKIMTGDKVTGAKYSLDYDLPGYDWNGFLKPEYASELFVDTVDTIFKISDSTGSGSYEFTLNKLKNMTYNVELRTDAGNRYTATFVVDYADGAGMATEAYTGSLDAPKLWVEGLPDVEVSAPVSVTLKSDIPVIFSWNGSIVSSSYVSEATVDVYSSGDYWLEGVTPVGKVTREEIQVSNVSGNFMAGNDLVESSGLVQTGFEMPFEFNLLSFCLIVGFFAVALGVVVIKRRVK